MWFSFDSTDAETGNNKPNGGTVSPSGTLLINDQAPSVLRNGLLGHYKGFSIKPLTAPLVAVPTRLAPTRPPIRPAPAAPLPPTTTTQESSTRVQRPLISGPVLDATTSSAVREMVDVPLKPAPPVPTVARPASLAVGGGGGGGGTLRRIASFMKSGGQTEDKRPSAVASTPVRANSKFMDRESLKNLEISEPILQTEINVLSEPLPLEADRRRAVVLRAQSLRTGGGGRRRAAVPSFGSMRSAERPPSTSRPTAPPPQPPPPPATAHPSRSDGYQVPRPRPGLPVVAVRRGPSPVENIYSVIDDSSDDGRPAADSVYKVPRPCADSGSLLGEIVSAIQERNNDSIYTSKTQAVTGGGESALGDRPDLVKNCDENRVAVDRSPDVLDAKKKPPVAGDKPSVVRPKPVIARQNGGGGAPAARQTSSDTVATVGLKKKMSKVADIQKRFERGGGLINEANDGAKC